MPATSRSQDVVRPHVLQRTPAWLCDAGDPWPCAARRRDLLGRYAHNLAELRRWMTDCREKFIADNPNVNGADADARFLDWIPQAA